MAAYLGRRLIWLVVVLVGVSLLTFTLGVLAPGDPAELMLERELGQAAPTAEQIAARRREMGLDKPLVVQYLVWTQGVVRGDLGHSWARDEEVFDLITQRIPRTAVLGLTALTLAVVAALPMGIAAAYRQRSWVDHSSRVLALLGASLPNYFLGYLLMFLFAVTLPWLPVYGSGSLRHLVLPSVTLATGVMALLTRLTRASVLEVLHEDYIQTARAKGTPERVMLLKHALPNAAIPILTVVGLYIGHLLAGAVIVEWIFNWPGLGRLGLDAIHQRDFPVIQGFVLFTGTIYVLANLVTDVLYAVADPRVRLQTQVD